MKWRPSLPKFQPGGLVLGFALLCVGVTSGFVMYMSVWMTKLLSDPSWCDRAIGAAKENAAGRPESAFGGCFALLTQQMSALAINSFIFAGVIALCLLVLMLIVVAGGKMSFSGTREGLSMNIAGRDEAPAPPSVVTTTTQTSVATPASPPAPTTVVVEEAPTIEDTP